MKFLAILFLSTTGFFSEVNEKNSPDESKATLVVSVHQAYHHFLQNAYEACVRSLSSKKLQLVKEVNHYVPKDATVDSLVFENDSLKIWGYFKSVDLGYLRNVEMVFAFETTNPRETCLQLIGLLEGEGKKITSRKENEIRFKDQQAGYIIDERFEQPSRSFTEGLYDFTITTIERFVVIEFTEAVPAKFELQNLMLANQN